MPNVRQSKRRAVPARNGRRRRNGRSSTNRMFYPTPSMSVPAAYGTEPYKSVVPTISDVGNKTHLRGSELLEYVKRPTVVGPIAAHVLLNPLYWINTRTAALLRLYEKWRINSMIFHYVPSCGTATVGTVVMAIDYDVDDSLPTTVSQLAGYPGAVAGSCYTHMSVAFDRKMKGDDLLRYVDCDDVDTFRLSSEGQLVVANDQLGEVEVVYGNIFVTYDIEVCTPDNPKCEEKIVSYLGVDAAPTIAAAAINTPAIFHLPALLPGVVKLGYTVLGRLATAALADVDFVNPFKNQWFWLRCVSAIATGAFHLFLNTEDMSNDNPIDVLNVIGAGRASPIMAGATFYDIGQVD